MSIASIRTILGVSAKPTGAEPPPPERHPRPLVSEAVVALGFVVVAVYATWPLVLHAGTRLPFNLIDPLLNTYIFAWVAHAIAHNPLHIFNANAFYPDRLSLAFTENEIGQALPVAPIYWLTHNAVLTVNAGTILIYTLGGYGAYLLARELGASRGPAFVGGVVFTVAPYRLSQIVHTHVIALHIAPFLLVALLRLRTRWSRRRIPLIGLLFAAQFWTSLSGGAMTLVLIGVWVAWEIVRSRRAATAILLRGGAGLALGTLLIVPLFIPYALARQDHPEYTHPESDTLLYSATLRSYLSPGQGGLLARPSYQWLGRQFVPEGAPWEKHEFPGWVVLGATLAIAGAACWSLGRLRGDHPPWAAPALLGAGIAVAGFILSLGPRFDGNPSGFLLPFDLLDRLTPGRLLRVPARFGSLVPLGLGLLIAMTLSRIDDQGRRLMAVGALVGLIALELVPSEIPTVRVPAISPAYRAIAHMPGAVLGLPTAEVGANGDFVHVIDREPFHLYDSTVNWRPIANGYTAFFPRHWQEIVREVQHFPSDMSIHALQARKVDTIVIDTALAKGTRWESAARKLRNWPGVRLAADLDGTIAFDISRANVHSPD